jgi:ankyrin repeat protein
MAIRSLPPRPSWEHLRNEARMVQRRVRSGDPTARALAREFHPRFEERAASFRLSDGQLTVARSYGQASWPKLKTYVEAVTRYRRDPHEVAPRSEDADEFLRLACLVYGGDDRSRPARAADMLRRDPSLAGRSIFTAAATGDAAAAARALGRDRSLAVATGGPVEWEPLLYAAYSRVVADDRSFSCVAVARLLLDHGADPHAGYLWDGTYLFTALTGAFGYGEDAPNQPPHHESAALAELLLEAGADPNDDQAIYNRHFRPDNDHLELLLAYGLGGPRRGPWPHRLGDHLTDPRLLLEDALVFTADNDAYAERVALLLRHGVDPDGRGTQHPALRGLRPVERARSGGAETIERLLLEAGATPPASDPIDDLLALCMRGDRNAVERDATLAAALIRRHPRALIDAAGRGNARGVELLAHIGYDVNRRDGHTALHLAAYAGDRRLCELLLSLGADPAIRDDSFDAPAWGWAGHAHHDQLAAWLEEQDTEGRS